MQHKAKKSLGQHFLVQPGIARKIAASLSLEGYDQILEVGPGKGILTTFLLDLPCTLTAVELDRVLSASLEALLEENDFRIIQGDFLKQDLDILMDGRQFALAGNFPYMISSQILFKMLENKHLIPEMVGMFQKEMAQRIIAVPGTKAYGILSVMTQISYQGKILFHVGNKNFSPPPKVESAVIGLKRKEIHTPPCNQKLLKTIVKLSFGKRRKMLRNSLKGLIPNQSFDIDPVFTMRPDSISTDGFIKLTNLIEQVQSAGR